MTLHGDPTQSGTTVGRMQTGRRPAHAGSRLEPLIIQESIAWKAQPSSRTGETRRTE